MKVLMSALQGSVLFLVLLVSQIIIVASLTLTAFWLYFKRVREHAIGDEENLQSPNPTETLERVSFLESKVATLESEKKQYLNTDTINALNEEKNKVSDLLKETQQKAEKIKGLEEKLIEFEVLKDEIGQLSQFKLENQNLKEEMARLQDKVSKEEPPKASLATSESLPVASVPSITAVESSPQIQNTPEVNSVSTPVAQSSTDSGLEGLLSEIEALTSESKDPLKKSA